MWHIDITTTQKRRQKDRKENLVEVMREKTYHHLSSEELGDGSLNTSAFHFVFHIVKKLEHTTTHSMPIIILPAYTYTPTFIQRL